MNLGENRFKNPRKLNYLTLTRVKLNNVEEVIVKTFFKSQDAVGKLK